MQGTARALSHGDTPFSRVLVPNGSSPAAHSLPHGLRGAWSVERTEKGRREGVRERPGPQREQERQACERRAGRRKDTGWGAQGGDLSSPEGRRDTGSETEEGQRKAGRGRNGRGWARAPGQRQRGGPTGRRRGPVPPSPTIAVGQLGQGDDDKFFREVEGFEMVLQLVHDQAEVVSGQGHQGVAGHFCPHVALHLQGTGGGHVAAPALPAPRLLRLRWALLGPLSLLLSP